MSVREVKNLTLIDLLQNRARQQPDRIAYIWLKDGEKEEKTLTYQQLHTQAKAIASRLNSLQSNNVPVILIYPYDRGLEFITAFFGCLYAGAIAIPCHPPQNRLALKDLQGRLISSQAKVIVTTRSILNKIKQQLPELDSQLSWLDTESIQSNPAINYQIPAFAPDKLAFFSIYFWFDGNP